MKAKNWRKKKIKLQIVRKTTKKYTTAKTAAFLSKKVYYFLKKRNKFKEKIAKQKKEPKGQKTQKEPKKTKRQRNQEIKNIYRNMKMSLREKIFKEKIQKLQEK